MEVTGGQPTTLKGLSKFLVEHEPCGAGFDVSHPAGLGSGRVSMTCRGCGLTYEYATATIEFEREVEFEPVALERQAKVAPPPPPTDVAQPAVPAIAAAAATETQDPPGPPPDDPAESPAVEADDDDGDPGSKPSPPPRAKGWTRDRVITGGLLLFSAAALIFAVVRIATGASAGGEETPTATTPPSKQAKPAPAAPAAPPHPAKPKPAPKPPPPQKPAADTRVVKTDRFTVTVPKDWTQRAASGGGTLLAPPGSAQVSLQIFYENDPGLSTGKMSVQTAGFLTSRDPEAAVSAAKTLRIAGHPAFEISANGPAGTQLALGVASGPYRYLAIVSADPGTPRSVRATAQTAMLSLKPR